MTADTDIHTDTEWLSAEEQVHWRAFITGVMMLERRLKADMLAAHDLSMDDYAILAMLSEAEGDRLRFGELADILRVPKAHITYRFRRLESQGLVQRKACESDARGAYAVLTATGRARIEQAAPTHVTSVRRRVLDHLTEGQLVAIGEGMRTIIDADSGEAPDRY